MRPPRGARPPSRRPWYLLAAFVCILVFILRGRPSGSEVQRQHAEAEELHGPFALHEQEQEEFRDAEQHLGGAESGGTLANLHGEQQQQEAQAGGGAGIEQQLPVVPAERLEAKKQADKGEQPPPQQEPQQPPQQEPKGEQQPKQEQAPDALDGPRQPAKQQPAEQAAAAEEEEAQQQQPTKQGEEPAGGKPAGPKQQHGKPQPGKQGGSAGKKGGGDEGGSDEEAPEAQAEGEGEQQQQEQAEEEGEGGPTGGWSDSFLKSKADGNLGHLLDMTSLMSPLRTCAADGFSLDIQEQEAEELLADLVQGRPGGDGDAAGVGAQPEPTLVSGMAHNLPCTARRGGGACCDHPVTFRKNTTDYRVFKQVFQCHYMRYLYTLFGDEPPKYILDAGANAGFSTILFKLLWPDATVVMLEPDPSNFAILSRNVATLKGVHPINAGLWGRSANITVKANHGNWGKVFQEAEEGQPGMPAYSVADVAKLAGVPAFDFVKIDIEGAEGQVFAPGRDVSWITKARAVSLELHDFFASYFGLERSDISARVDAAFNSTGYSLVSDNEHIIYLNPQLQATVAQLRAPVPKLVAIRESRLKKVNGC